MTLKLTVISPTVNLRRGPTAAASRVAEARVGEQFEVLQLLDLKAPEQWAKIVYPGHLDGDFYLCVTQPSGNKLCQVSNTPAPANPEYQRGWTDCLEAVHQMLVTLRK